MVLAVLLMDWLLKAFDYPIRECKDKVLRWLLKNTEYIKSLLQILQNQIPTEAQYCVANQR